MITLLILAMNRLRAAPMPAPSPGNLGGWAPGNGTESGDLPATPDMPSWWNNSPVEGAGTRDAAASWNCCCAALSFNTNLTTSPQKQ